jgi:hypothetical protein
VLEIREKYALTVPLYKYLRQLVEQLRENITLTKQGEGNWWHQGKDRPEKIKTFRTQPIY